MCTTFDGRVGSHIFNSAIYFDDAQCINGDHVESSGQVVDGCRVEKSTKTLYRILG